MADCPHHWLIDPVSGPESKGRCKLCGRERTFANYPRLEVHDVNRLTWQHKGIALRNRKPTAAYYEAI